MPWRPYSAASIAGCPFLRFRSSPSFANLLLSTTPRPLLAIACPHSTLGAYSRDGGCPLFAAPVRRPSTLALQNDVSTRAKAPRRGATVAQTTATPPWRFLPV